LAGSPGSADGTNDSARFDGIRGLAVDAATNLFVTEIGSHVIRMVTPLGTNWVVNTIAGLAGSPGAADGTNSAARFNRPYDVTVDGSGNLFVTDNGNALIRMVTPCGSNWVVRTISGQAGQNATLDGINTNALFTGPDGIAVDGMGNLFVTDIDDYTIRELRLIGTNLFAATIGGVAGMAGSTDGLNSTALFNWPSGIAVDGAGNLYLAEIANDTIRMGTPLQARPSLTAFFATHSLVLSWPLSAAGFALE
jgi:sugar lactone lactonase YvrE